MAHGSDKSLEMSLAYTLTTAGISDFCGLQKLLFASCSSQSPCPSAYLDLVGQIVVRMSSDALPKIG